MTIWGYPTVKTCCSKNPLLRYEIETAECVTTWGIPAVKTCCSKILRIRDGCKGYPDVSSVAGVFRSVIWSFTLLILSVLIDIFQMDLG